MQFPVARRFWHSAAGLRCWPMSPAIAAPQAYPTSQFGLCAFSSGGAIRLCRRPWADKMKPSSERRVIETRAGGALRLGAAAGARAPT